jgi:hypothetical protein
LLAKAGSKEVTPEDSLYRKTDLFSLPVRFFEQEEIKIISRNKVNRTLQIYKMQAKLVAF